MTQIRGVGNSSDINLYYIPILLCKYGMATNILKIQPVTDRPNLNLFMMVKPYFNCCKLSAGPRSLPSFSSAQSSSLPEHQTHPSGNSSEGQKVQLASCCFSSSFSCFSLYEGWSGTVCFLVDLVHHDSAAFPFSDVFVNIGTK